jgi:hypothetical protein
LQEKEYQCSGHVKLEVMRRKKRGKHGRGIASAVHILNMMIHTILKSSQEIETKALVKPFRFEDYLSEL